MTRHISIILLTLLLAAGCSGTPEPQMAETPQDCESQIGKLDAEWVKQERAKWLNETTTKLGSLSVEETRLFLRGIYTGFREEVPSHMAAAVRHLETADDQEVDRLKQEHIAEMQPINGLVLTFTANHPRALCRDFGREVDDADKSGFSGFAVNDKAFEKIERHGHDLGPERACNRPYLVVLKISSGKTLHFYCHREPNFVPMAVFRAVGDGWRREP